jgi:hypothetical protein
MELSKGIKVTSFFPGRVRLHVAELKHASGLCRTAETELARVPGITQVETNAALGSMLIRYDRRALAQPHAAEALVSILDKLFPGHDFGRLSHWLGG